MITSVRESDPLRVLIVDRSIENQEVLSAALSSRGVQALLATDAAQGLEHVSRSAPDCMVLDVESIPEHAEGSAALASAARDFGERLIVLGAVRRQGDRFGGGSFVAKPYHYGPLIRTIEALLEQR